MLVMFLVVTLDTYYTKRGKECTFPHHLRLLTTENIERFLVDIFRCEYNTDTTCKQARNEMV